MALGRGRSMIGVVGWAYDSRAALRVRSVIASAADPEGQSRQREPQSATPHFPEGVQIPTFYTPVHACIRKESHIW